MAKTRRSDVDNRHDPILRSKLLAGGGGGGGGDASEATSLAILAELGLKADLLETQPVSNVAVASLLSYVDVTAKYAISRSDTGGAIEYYGFIDTAGAWYILEITIAAGTYLYVQGAAGTFLANWAARGGLAYVEFNTLVW